MVLYTLYFEDFVSQEKRHKIASDFEVLYWEVGKNWEPADHFSGNLNVVSLNITSWNQNPPPLPILPTGCHLQKL